jgi:hypothetical protein
MAVEIRIPGQNGAGDEVFTAENHEELSKKLAESKGHATRKIAEQQAAISEYESNAHAVQQPVVAPVKDGEFDRTKYFNMLYENPLQAQEYALKFVLGGRDPKEFVSEYDQIKEGALLGRQNAINAQFVHNHPELLQVTPADDIENAKTIDKIVKDNGWTYNLNNLEAAYAVAKTQNKLKLPEAQQQQQQEPIVPITTGRPAAQQTSAEQQEAEFLRTGDINKVRDYLEKKYQGQPVFAPTVL